MRIVHTADNHLDACFAGAGMPPEIGNQRRDALRSVFHAIMRRAVDWPADAVLVAGDLFELDRLGRDTLAFLRETLESIQPIPVFIAPGNRDPFVDYSPYVTETWPENVHIFDRPAWAAFALDQQPLTIHGFAFDGAVLSSNPFGALTLPKDGRVHVAVTHGSEQGLLPVGKEECAPFRASDAVADGLHYLALGHYHTLVQVQVQGDFAAQVYYPGTPEGLGFDEPGPHYYLEVEIEPRQDGSPEVRVTPVASSQSVYAVHTFEGGAYANPHQLLQAVRALAGKSGLPSLVRVRLTGACPAALRNALESIEEMAREDFVFLDIVDETYPSDAYPDLAHDDTALGVFVRRIHEEIQDAPDDETRWMLARAREVGVAAYRAEDVPVLGLAAEAP